VRSIASLGAFSGSPMPFRRIELTGRDGASRSRRAPVPDVRLDFVEGR
jgi:hypothetical protein